MSFSTYVFDAYGTLFDVHAAVRRYANDVGPDWQRLSELWRSKQLEYTWTRTLTGQYRDFAHVTQDALHTAMAMVGIVDQELEASLLSSYDRLDAYSEAAAVLRRLRDRGARVVVLTNGTELMVRSAVAASTLDGLIDQVISVDQLRVYKPDARIYRLMTDKLGLPPQHISFQSSNRWDVAGASKFGFRTVWVNRYGAPDEYPDMPPAYVLHNLNKLPDLEWGVTSQAS